MPSDADRIPRPVEVRALPNYRIWLRYDDGVQGEIDLSQWKGRGVFAAWDDPNFFQAVRLAPHGAVEWRDEIDLCPDALYMQLTGKSPEEMFPALKPTHVDA
jgi:hypothetical protein